MPVINNKSLSVEDINADIVAYLGNNTSVNPEKWLDTFSSGAGMTIAEMIAGLGSYISFAALNSRKEAFPDTAKQESSIYSIANMRGLAVNRPEAPKLVIEFESPVLCPSVVGKVGNADVVAVRNHYTEDGILMRNTYDCYLGRWESSRDIYPDGIPISNPQGFSPISITPTQDAGERKFYIDNDIRNITVSVTRAGKNYSMRLSTSPEDLMREDGKDDEYADVLLRTTVDGVNLIFGGSSESVYKGGATEVLNNPIKLLYSDEKIIVAGTKNESLGIFYTKDGETWYRSNIVKGNFNSVVKSDAKYFAASGDLGGIYSSYDGMKWEVSLSPSGDQFVPYGPLMSGVFPNVPQSDGTRKAEALVLCYAGDGSLVRYDVDGNWYTCFLWNFAGNPATQSYKYRRVNGLGTGGDVVSFVANKDMCFICRGDPKRGQGTRLYYSSSGIHWTQLSIFDAMDTDTMLWNWDHAGISIQFVKEYFFAHRTGLGLSRLKPTAGGYTTPGDFRLTGPTEVESKATYDENKTIRFENVSTYSGSISNPTSGEPLSTALGRDLFRGVTDPFYKTTLYSYGMFNDITYSEENKCYLAATDMGLLKSTDAWTFEPVHIQGDNQHKVGTLLTVDTASVQSELVEKDFSCGYKVFVLPPAGIAGVEREFIDGIPANTNDNYYLAIDKITLPGRLSGRYPTEPTGGVNNIYAFSFIPSGLTGLTNPPGGKTRISSLCLRAEAPMPTSQGGVKLKLVLWNENKTVLAVSTNANSWDWGEVGVYRRWTFDRPELDAGTKYLASLLPEDADVRWENNAQVRLKLSANRAGWELFTGVDSRIAGAPAAEFYFHGAGEMKVKAVVASARKSVNPNYRIIPRNDSDLPLYDSHPIKILAISNAVSNEFGNAAFYFSMNPLELPLVSKDESLIIYFTGLAVTVSPDSLAMDSPRLRTIDADAYVVSPKLLGAGWVGTYSQNSALTNVVPKLTLSGARHVDSTFKFDFVDYVKDAEDILGRSSIVPEGSGSTITSAFLAGGKEYDGLVVLNDVSEGAIRYTPSQNLKYEGVGQIDKSVFFNTEEGVLVTNATGKQNSSSPLVATGNPVTIGFPLKDGDALYVEYLSSQGRSGIADIEADNVALSIDNKVLSVDYLDGGVKEEVDKIRAMIPGYNSSYRRLVSRSDFVANTLAARTDVFSANAYKCPYDCCTAVVPYLRGFKDVNGFIVRTGFSPDADEAFNTYMREKLYKYKMIGTEVLWSPAQETKLELNLVITIERGVDEEEMRNQIKDYLIARLYKINGSFSIGEVVDFIGELQGTRAVHAVKPNSDYKCIVDEYLATDMDQIVKGIKFKYDVNDLVFDEDVDFGYKNPVVRMPNGYTRVRLKQGIIPGDATGVSDSDVMLGYSFDYEAEYIGAIIRPEDSSGIISTNEDDFYYIDPVANTPPGTKPRQDEKNKFFAILIGESPDGVKYGLRAKIIRATKNKITQCYLRLYTNTYEPGIPIGSATYQIVLTAYGSDGITRSTVSERLQIEIS